MHKNDNNIEFSDLFFKNSKVEFNNNLNSSATGKGPLVCDENQIVKFDLNPFQERYSLLGYNHPLEIKSKLEVQEATLSNIENSFFDTFLEKQSYFIQFKDRTTLNKSIHGPWSAIKKNDSKEIITTGIFGIGNNWKEKFDQFLSLNEEVHVHNFLPLDFIISKKNIETKNTFFKKEVLNFTELVIRYFSNGPFYIENGRFDPITKFLLKHFPEEHFNVSNLTISISTKNQNLLEELSTKGIIANHINNKTILSFPISLLESHVEEVRKIINTIKIEKYL